MNIGNLFRGKTEESGAPNRKDSKSEASKKNAGKPVKTRKPDQPKKLARKPDEPRMQWWNDLREYLREVVYELRKVVWPSRKETFGSTSVVLVIVIISGLFLGLVDVILSRLVRMLVG